MLLIKWILIVLFLCPLWWLPILIVMMSEEHAFGFYSDPEDNRRYCKRMLTAWAYPLLGVVFAVLIYYWAQESYRQEHGDDVVESSSLSTGTAERGDGPRQDKQH